MQLVSGMYPALVQAPLSVSPGVTGRGYNGFTGEYLLLTLLHLTAAIHRCRPVTLNIGREITLTQTYFFPGITEESLVEGLQHPSA